MTTHPQLKAARDQIEQLENDKTTLLQELRTTREERDKLKARVPEFGQPWEGDKPLPEDAAINRAHPLMTQAHELYREAMRLVGARHSKYGLVELVNWLLCRTKRMQGALLAAAKVFDTYKELHRAKVPPQNHKADVNRKHADACRKAAQV